MFQGGQHPVFSMQAENERKVTAQLPERHHNYLISHLSSQDQPPIRLHISETEKKVVCVCGAQIGLRESPN